MSSSEVEKGNEIIITPTLPSKSLISGGMAVKQES